MQGSYLNIKVESATGLRPGNESCNAYVRLTLDELVLNSKIIENNKNPTWKFMSKLYLFPSTGPAQAQCRPITGPAHAHPYFPRPIRQNDQMVTLEVLNKI